MMNKPPSTPLYFAFLLRLWQENDKSGWRASLEDPHTGERKGFGSLPQLVEYLEKETGQKLTGENIARD